MKSTRKKTDPPAAADGGNPTVETAAGVDEVEQLAPSAVEEPESPTAEEEEEEADDDDGEEEEPEGETLKLEEGFYEIEDIRKKRIRKSQLQYLIKWRGWPESANTWEPADNLDACADIVDAFEERLRTPRSSRKRRRRQSAGPHTTASAKKKRPARGPNTTDSKEDATDCEAGEQDENEEENKKELLADEHKPPTEPAEANRSPADHTKDPPQGSAAAVAAATAAAAAASTDEKNGLPLAAGFITIDLTGAEDPCMEGTSKAPSEVSSHFRGAKKRKSGSVRRFKQDPPPNSQDVDQSTAVKHENGSADRPNEDVDSTEDETGDKTATPDADYAGDPKPSITKIIMPVRYFASVTNNVQEVAITFKALRSDGKEVLVDDKHLKANNPLLLIGYYEQHLRYNPHA